MRLQGWPSTTSASSGMREGALCLAVLSGTRGRGKILEDGNVGGVGFLIFINSIVCGSVGTCVGMLMAGNETV